MTGKKTNIWLFMMYSNFFNRLLFGDLLPNYLSSIGYTVNGLTL